MKIIDLVALLKTKRNKILEKSDIFISNILFRVKLSGFDIVPNVGRVTLSKDNKKVIINLNKKWVDLLNGDNFEEHTLEYLLKKLYEV